VRVSSWRLFGQPIVVVCVGLPRCFRTSRRARALDECDHDRRLCRKPMTDTEPGRVISCGAGCRRSRRHGRRSCWKRTRPTGRCRGRWFACSLMRCAVEDIQERSRARATVGRSSARGPQLPSVRRPDAVARLVQPSARSRRREGAGRATVGSARAGRTAHEGKPAFRGWESARTARQGREMRARFVAIYDDRRRPNVVDHRGKCGRRRIARDLR
jgi:hypothetical protein